MLVKVHSLTPILKLRQLKWELSYFAVNSKVLDIYQCNQFLMKSVICLDNSYLVHNCVRFMDQVATAKPSPAMITAVVSSWSFLLTTMDGWTLDPKIWQG